MTTTTAKSEPHRPCFFTEGQLVTCSGPFNSGRDDEGYWRRAEAVVSVRWEPSSRGFKGRQLGCFWRVAVPGFSGNETCFSPAPDGTKVGDIIRTGPVGG